MNEEKTNSITVNVNTRGLDEALEKANRLKELLSEVHELIRSLGTVN